MANLVVVHHGLGLWVNRDGFWEILFPDATKMTLPGAKAPLDEHEPALCVPSAVIGGIAVAFTVFPLKNRKVDFRGLAEGNPKAVFGLSTMIGLEQIKGAPAADPEAFANHKDKVVGTAIFPTGKLEPTVAAVGPVDFRGNSNRFVAFAVTWSAPICAAALSSDGKEASIDLVDRESGAIEKVPLKVNAAGDIELRIRNLSNADLTRAPGTRSRIDVDFAAHYVLAPPSDGKLEVPQFQRAVFPAPGSIAAAMGSLTGADETHLCSGAFMLPPPPGI